MPHEPVREEEEDITDARSSVVTDPATRSAADVDRSTRSCGIGRIIVLDVAAPLILFSLLRRHGVSEMTSLIVSGIPPAVAVLADFIRFRKLEVVGAVALSGIVMGVALGLITHSARAVLLEGAVPTFTFALACLVSLRGRRPLMFHFALASSGGDQSERGQALDARYAEQPRIAHFFRVVTLVWGSPSCSR